MRSCVRSWQDVTTAADSEITAISCLVHHHQCSSNRSNNLLVRIRITEDRRAEKSLDHISIWRLKLRIPGTRACACAAIDFIASLAWTLKDVRYKLAFLQCFSPRKATEPLIVILKNSPSYFSLTASLTAMIYSTHSLIAPTNSASLVRSKAIPTQREDHS